MCIYAAEIPVGGGKVESMRGENPRGIRALGANHRWERWFVRFLELSWVGRTMADGTDEDAAHAAEMDEWVVWETREARGEG